MFPELSAILSKFKSPMGKVRLISLGAKARLKPHIDFPYYEQIRLHAVLRTNSKVWWEIGDQEVQIPADGSFYWYDTGIPHAIRNEGDSDRLILSLHLSPFFAEDGSPRLPAGADLIQILSAGEI
jgi:quercetin dioxygenase-like cupin family protein